MVFMAEDDITNLPHSLRVIIEQNPDFRQRYTHLVRQRDSEVGKAARKLEKATTNGWSTKSIKDPSQVRVHFDGRIAKLYERFATHHQIVENAVGDPESEELYSPAIVVRSPAPIVPPTHAEESMPLIPGYTDRVTSYLTGKRAELDEARTRVEQLAEKVQRLEDMHARYTTLSQLSDTELTIRSNNERLSTKDQELLRTLPGGLERKTTAADYFGFQREE